MALKFLNSGYFAGKVGIGTESPGASLEIGNLIADAAGFIISSPGSEVNVNFSFIIGDTSLGLHSKNLVIKGSSGSSDIAFSPSSTYPGLMVLDGSAGNVGIGTTSPSEKLQVDGAVKFGQNSNIPEAAISHYTNGYLYIKGGSSGLAIGNNDYNANIYLTNGDAVQISTSGSDRMIVTSGGNVGIGTTSPGSKLHVSGGDIELDDGYKVIFNDVSGTVTASEELVLDAGNTDSKIILDGADSAMQFITGNSTAIYIRDTQNVGIGTTSPVEKLEVSGNIKATRVISNIIRDTNGNGQLITTVVNASNTSTVVGNTATANTLSLGVKSSGDVLVPNGNVGIGTTSPSEKLTVLGVGSFGTSTSQTLVNYDGLNAVGNTDYIRFKVDNSEKLRITSSGNVGIGTTSPDKQLTFEQVNDDAIQIRRLTTSEGNNSVGSGISWTWNNSSSDTETWAAIRAIMPGSGNSHITFSTRASAASFGEKMRISDIGNVGIGTTSPASRLDVSGGDIEVKDIASGIIMKSPDGTRYRVTIANGGTLSVAAV